jgi:predicted amidohydrolase
MGSSLEICAVQAAWPIFAYADAETFGSHLRGYLERFRAERTAGSPALVAFPEFIGLPLMFLGHAGDLKGVTSWTEALTRVIQLHGEAVGAACARFGVGPVRGLMLARGEEVRSVYTEAFRTLARECGVFLLAGSAPLPGKGGAVHNTAVLFGPHGDLLGEQRKVHPYDREGTAEGLDISPADPDDVKVFETEIGRIGIAVCYDAWQEDVMGRLTEQCVEIVIQPSANAGPWNEWQEGDWERGLLRQVREKAFRCGVNPMMVGHVFAPGDEYDCQGRSAIIGTEGYLARSPEEPWSQYTREGIVICTLEAGSG